MIRRSLSEGFVGSRWSFGQSIAMRSGFFLRCFLLGDSEGSHRNGVRAATHLSRAVGDPSGIAPVISTRPRLFVRTISPSLSGSSRMSGVKGVTPFSRDPGDPIATVDVISNRFSFLAGNFLTEDPKVSRVCFGPSRSDSSNDSSVCRQAGRCYPADPNTGSRKTASRPVMSFRDLLTIAVKNHRAQRTDSHEMITLGAGVNMHAPSMQLRRRGGFSGLQTDWHTGAP